MGMATCYTYAGHRGRALQQFSATRQGCSTDDDKGIAAAVMCCDLKSNANVTRIKQRQSREAGRELTMRAVAGSTLRTSERHYIWGLFSTLAPRAGSELPLVDVMQSVPLAHTYWPIVSDRTGT